METPSASFDETREAFMAESARIGILAVYQRYLLGADLPHRVKQHLHEHASPAWVQAAATTLTAAACH